MLLKVLKLLTKLMMKLIETCIQAKQLNVKNEIAVIKVNNPLEVIYSNIAGHIDPV